MSSPKAGLRVAALAFAVIGLVHLWRVLAHWEVRVAAFDVPMWPSLVAVIGGGILSIWMWRLSGRS